MNPTYKAKLKELEFQFGPSLKTYDIDDIHNMIGYFVLANDLLTDTALIKLAALLRSCMLQVERGPRRAYGGGGELG